MSASSVSCCARSKSEERNDQFLSMLPTITRIARRAFRAWNPNEREELVTEAIASAYVQFCRLQDRGAADQAFATPLGHYGVRHAHGGRRVGGHLNMDDVSSVYCRRHRKVNLVQLTRPSSERSGWREILVEDRRATPAHVAAVRLDFEEWLNRLPARECRVAMYLATGEPTCDAAVRFGVSRGRISQIRAKLRNSWEEFQGDETLPFSITSRGRRCAGRC